MFIAGNRAMEQRYQKLGKILTFKFQSSIRGTGRNRVLFHQEGVLKLLLKRFCGDERGATAIEYGLIAAGISLAIIAAVNGLGSKLNTTYGNISTSLK